VEKKREKEKEKRRDGLLKRRNTNEHCAGFCFFLKKKMITKNMRFFINKA
jgi:hypothetical protein